MTGIALDPEGMIWTFNRGEIPVQAYSPDGHLSVVWDMPGLFSVPHSIRCDSFGNLWTADLGSHTVRKHDRNGRVLLTLGVTGEPGCDKEHFNMPTDIGFHQNGDIYVSDGYGNDRIVVFDGTGKYCGEWGAMGLGEGQFSLPHSVALDNAGRVYVADRNNNRLQVFDSSGRFERAIRNTLCPWHVLILPDQTVCLGGSSPMLWEESDPNEECNCLPPKDQLMMKFDSTGRLLRLWSFPVGKSAGELSWMHSLAVDAGGVLYAGDIRGQRVQRFIPTGQNEEKVSHGEGTSTLGGTKV